MLTLAQASSYFDRTQAYTVADIPLFKCQVDPYDDSKRDAGSAYRRVMSVKPGTAIPTDRIVKLLGEVWVVGASEPDGMKDLHREKYVLLPAGRAFNVSTLSGYLTGAIASSTYGSAYWLKDTKQFEVSSVAPAIYELTVPRPALTPLHSVLWDTEAAYLVLAEHETASGATTLQGLLLDPQDLGTATVVSRAYSPSSGEYVVGVSVTAPVLTVRWQSLFRYDSQASERYQEGDVSLVFAPSVVIDTATSITIGGKQYRAEAVQVVSGACVVHARGA